MKTKQIFDTLASYCDNDLDEVFLEEPQNHLANNQINIPTKIIDTPPANIDVALANLAKKNLFTTHSIYLENIVQSAKNLADSSLSGSLGGLSIAYARSQISNVLSQ
jgi:hypothetical protein